MTPDQILALATLAQGEEVIAAMRQEPWFDQVVLDQELAAAAVEAVDLVACNPLLAQAEQRALVQAWILNLTIIRTRRRTDPTWDEAAFVAAVARSSRAALDLIPAAPEPLEHERRIA